MDVEIEKHADALAVCQSLLRCPSVTPADAGALDTLQRLLDGAGFATHRVHFAEPGTPDIDNLYARIGTGAPYLLFAGHTDVVPPGAVSAWRHDPFGGEVADGMVWGRGAADMKGGIAAFAAAALDYIAKNGAPKGSIGFLITGDEEGPAINGTTKLLDWAHDKGERFDHCIVGEPTSRASLGDMIKIGRRGSLNGRLTVHGRQGHVAYPHKADNPIPALLTILQALLAPALDAGTAHFDPTNLEVTSIDVGNAATNIIPAGAVAAFNIRFNDTWSAETLAAELSRRAAAVAGEVRYTLAFLPCNAPSFLTPTSPFTDLAADAIAAETGHRPELSTSGGTSDARFIRKFCPVIELGLVGDTMHMVDERVPVADLEQLTAVYGRILAAYFG
ncbi:succinyl-diaminopimelate desuccinylase [Beijerinckia sp. L45]|uniref:succinyl-diaminopimelate desuccinylase n=1 Tax=Beijerinckia sp. L45 TaxID=1641855 RepID=UPI00131C673B|nr:succinyl-diaminopimelate desuccinylase [Beijerinckia sp. L45]